MAEVKEISWQVFTEAGLTSEILSGWDDLAIARGLPYCAPAWMLSWGAPFGDGPDIQVGVVREGGEIIGVIPLVYRPTRRGGVTGYELLGSGISFRIEPLCVAGRQSAVAKAVGEMLSALAPRAESLSLRGVDPDSGWSEAISKAYPGPRGAKIVDRQMISASTLQPSAAADYAGWLRTKSRNFRQEAVQQPAPAAGTR